MARSIYQLNEMSLNTFDMQTLELEFAFEREHEKYYYSPDYLPTDIAHLDLAQFIRKRTYTPHLHYPSPSRPHGRSCNAARPFSPSLS